MVVDMILKAKAFIYRFSAIFGLRIYLAQREEDEFLLVHKFISLAEDIIEGEETSDINQFGLMRGIWHASNGFTTVYTGNMSFKDSIIAKVKHAFDFDYNSW
jgi:hypothetical protein